jgi:hypothetical protein
VSDHYYKQRLILMGLSLLVALSGLLWQKRKTARFSPVLVFAGVILIWLFLATLVSFLRGPAYKG